ncbi:hypothetical protein K456DRAFT_1915438 [Colletotrichum gloeosporioides 23]|nr:hypothetical protein K456DRAFT_1915438 [Colletotrichum gloeosporioides 23]
MSQRNWTERSSGYEPARVYDVEDEPPRPDTVEYKRYNVFSCSEWFMEIVTSIGSLVILATVAFIFTRVDGRPLSDWTFPISLNAVISILTTACSAAIMHGLHFKNGPQRLEHLETFDEASRGPLGSLKFLVSMKLNLATIGALVTICRLGLSPLAQQVVMVDEQFVNTTDNTVTFGYAHSYNRGVGRQLANTDTRGIPQDPNMQAAILQGLFNISTPSTFTCPGACRWQGSYVSLGFATDCRNVTQETLQSKICLKNQAKSTEHCNMTTPGNISLSTQHVFTDSGTSYQMNVSLLGNTRVFDVPDTFPEFARFALYRATPNSSFKPLNENITECSLSFAAYNYTGAQSNGTTFAFQNSQKIVLGGKELWNSNGSSYSSQLFTNKSTADDLPKFSLSWADFKALQNFFESGSIATEWVDGNYENKELGVSAALAGYVDVGKRFGQMAVSMTDYLRSGPNMQLALGEKIDNVPFVSIRWWFFAGPAAIEAFALLFAVLTIFSNRKNSRVPLWKSSALAVLACEHEEKSELLRTTAKDIKEMEKTAETSFVKLE